MSVHGATMLLEPAGTEMPARHKANASASAPSLQISHSAFGFSIRNSREISRLKQNRPDSKQIVNFSLLVEPQRRAVLDAKRLTSCHNWTEPPPQVGHPFGLR